MNKFFGTFVSGVFVYVTMAACSVAASPSSGTASGDAGGPGVLDPVPTASAATPTAAALETWSEPCNKVHLIPLTGYPNGYPQQYAEHLYPGATMGEIASSVVTITTISSPTATTQHPTDYANTASLPLWVRDGAAATPCSAAADTVVFVRR